jgi:hypothetical protein
MEGKLRNQEENKRITTSQLTNPATRREKEQTTNQNKKEE